MSYIRCLSNPEGLYVWSDGKNATISHEVRKPHSSGRNFTIPHGIFEGLLRRWVDFRKPARVRGAVAEELTVNSKTGRVIPPWKPCKRGCKSAGKSGFIPCRRCLEKQRREAGCTRYVVRLSYRGDFVDLWCVTWDYMTKRFDRPNSARNS